MRSLGWPKSKMEARCLNIVLVGMSGSGISSTGNTILGCQAFQTSSRHESLTETVSAVRGEFEGQKLLVVDCPGLLSTNKTDLEDFQAARRNKELVLRICNSSIDSFLLILNYKLFSIYYRTVVERLKDIFGSEFVNRVIIVMTHGDLFHKEINVTFEVWYRQQKDHVAEWFQTCNHRIVLFNNKPKDLATYRTQIHKILQFANNMSANAGVDRPLCSTTTNSASAQRLVQLPDNEKAHQEKMKVHFLLTGKTGHGKSSTGNLLIGSRVFESKSSTTAVTSEVTSHYTEYKNFIVKVVDTPGLMDTNLTREEDKIQASRNMNKAVSMCSEGVDAFLYVHRFGIRFTKEEIDSLFLLKNIFGELYMSHLIVIITYGDNFQTEMAFQNKKQSFKEWCEEQEGEFKELYKNSGARFVLINNLEEDEKRKQKQIDQVYQYVMDIKARAGRYTSECFKAAAIEREKKAKDNPILKEEIQEHLGLLTREIDNVCTGGSTREVEKILACINDTECVIDTYTSPDCSEIRANLNMLRHRVKQREFSDLKPLGKTIDRIRTASSIWENVSPTIQFIGDLLAFIPGSAGKILPLVLKGAGALGGAVIGGLRSHYAQK